MIKVIAQSLCAKNGQLITVILQNQTLHQFVYLINLLKNYMQNKSTHFTINCEFLAAGNLITAAIEQLLAGSIVI